MHSSSNPVPDRPDDVHGDAGTIHFSHTVHEEPVALTADAFQSRRARLRLALPLERLERGDYALTIDARTATQASGRALRFSVE